MNRRGAPVSRARSRRRARWYARWCAALLGPGLLLGCAGAPKTPEALRDAWLAALEHDDPAAAWALMSPAAQAATDREAFDARWASQRSTREAMARAAAPPATVVTTPTAVTVTARGHVLRWALVEGRLVVTEGLSPAVDRRTPHATLTAFAAALRQQDNASLAAVVAPSKCAFLGQRFPSR